MAMQRSIVWSTPVKGALCATERRRGIGLSALELIVCTSAIISAVLSVNSVDGTLAEGAAIYYIISISIASSWVLLKLCLLIQNVGFESLCFPISILFFVVILTVSVTASIHDNFNPVDISTIFGWITVLPFGLGVVWAAYQWWQEGCRKYIRSARGICGIIEMILDTSIIVCTSVGLDQADWFNIKRSHYTVIQLLLASAIIGLFWRTTSFFACYAAKEYSKSVFILLADVFVCLIWISSYIAAWIFTIMNTTNKPMLAAAGLAVICASSLCVHLVAVVLQLKERCSGGICLWGINKITPASEMSSNEKTIQFIEMNLRAKAPSKDNNVPSTDSKWEWKGELGRGRMGSVVLLRHRESQELIADKQMKPRDGTERNCLLQETRVLAHIRGWTHPHLTNFIASWDNTGTLHLFMEYCSEGSLEIAFRETARDNEYFTESQIINVLLHIAAGLLFIHQRNVIHRNLKPSNVLIGDNQFLKLSEIGFASGTYASVYISPEVQSGMEFSEASDIWSLGVIICRMIALEATPELARIVKSPPKQLRNDIDKEFWNLIKAMIEKKPAKRPTSENVIVANMNKVCRA